MFTYTNRLSTEVCLSQQGFCGEECVSKTFPDLLGKSSPRESNLPSMLPSHCPDCDEYLRWKSCCNSICNYIRWNCQKHCCFRFQLPHSLINAKSTTSDFLKLPRKHPLAILSMYKRLSYMHFLICRKNFYWLFTNICIVWLILQQGPPGGVSGMVSFSIQDVK